MVHFPARNEIARQALGADPEYAHGDSDRSYMILFPEDYEGHGVDVEGNVALLVDQEQAAEIRDLAEEIIERHAEADE